MKIFHTPLEITDYITGLKHSGKRIALVPTMGSLHDGHTSLLSIAKEHADISICYIYVNPTQFNNENDLKTYPRNLDEDIETLSRTTCDILFAPDNMYHSHFQTSVSNRLLAKDFEGAHRPGHFDGVCTVLAMFFNLLQPDVAVFGEKDFQQLRIVEQMVEDLYFPIQIIRAPLIREESGLALSSRNKKLCSEDRKKATTLYKALSAGKNAFNAGEKNALSVKKQVLNTLLEQPKLEVEYLACVNENMEEVETLTHDNRLLIAAWISGVRLIDNVVL